MRLHLKARILRYTDRTNRFVSFKPVFLHVRYEQHHLTAIRQIYPCKKRLKLEAE